MNYYLVDYENVKTHGLDGITSLDENDTVVIFYSDNADSLTFGLHRRLTETKAIVNFQRVDVGTKNALDFQLCTYLGYIICENEGEEAEYYVVSKDQGYALLVNYWARRKKPVYLVSDVKKRVEVNEIAVNTVEAVSVQEDDAEDSGNIEQKLNKLIDNKSEVPDIAKIISHYKTKQGINNALTKLYKDTKKSSKVYKAIKVLIADKK